MRFAIQSSLLTSFVLFGFANMPAFGQGAPDSLSFQGYLTDNLGNPLDSSGVSITFKLVQGGQFGVDGDAVG